MYLCRGWDDAAHQSSFLLLCNFVVWPTTATPSPSTTPPSPSTTPPSPSTTPPPPLHSTRCLCVQPGREVHSDLRLLHQNSVPSHATRPYTREWPSTPWTPTLNLCPFICTYVWTYIHSHQTYKSARASYVRTYTCTIFCVWVLRYLCACWMCYWTSLAKSWRIICQTARQPNSCFHLHMKSSSNYRLVKFSIT